MAIASQAVTGTVGATTGDIRTAESYAAGGTGPQLGSSYGVGGLAAGRS